jgi:Flp pilus assembly secretin CpaC
LTSANMNARPIASESRLSCSTLSIATAPVAAGVVAANSGWLSRVVAAAGGTTTAAPVTIAVSINGGSDVCGGNFQIPVGTGARNGTVYEFAGYGVSLANSFFINEGDCIQFTPSGATGASIPGAFAAVIRAI